MILEPGQLGQDNAEILGAIRDFDACQLFDAERIGPVVSHGAEVVEPVGIGHRAKVSGVFADLFVVTMEITENGLEFAHDLAVESNVHAKDAVGGGVLGAHRHFEQLAFEAGAHGSRWRQFEFLKSGGHIEN